MNYHIAIDVGGTQIRAAIYSETSLTPQRLERIATRDAHTTPLERMKNLVASIWPTDGRVAGVGLAVPGPVNPYEGIILAAPNIPGWIELPLRKILQESFSTPVALGNDANLAALGEWKYGAGKGHHHLIYLTISTGIGGGVIINDQLLLGSVGLAGEMGHITVLLDGPLCGCGQRGHLEAVASGTAIIRWVEDELSQGAVSILPADQPISGAMITQAAKKGDRLAIAALARAGSFIGQALADFVHIFNPSIVVFGGGVSQAGRFLLDPIRKTLEEQCLIPEYYKKLILTPSALGDEAGLMGALALARDLHPIME